MKKIIFMLSFVLILTMTSLVAFADEIIVSIDSNKVEFNDFTGSPFIDANSRTQVPFRETLEKYGATVNWNNDSRTAIATKGDVTIEVPIGENYIIKNGDKITNDTAAIIVNSKTYLPIRKVVEAFESEVQWDAEKNTVVITTEPIDAKEILMKAYGKSYLWKNYDGKIAMDMSMNLPDETGTIQPMNMKMNMVMTVFAQPMKLKATADMIMDFQGQNISQPLMDMYFNVDGEKFTTYMGINNGTGELTWTKSVIEDESLMDLLDYDLQANLAITEQYTKDVVYFGKYLDENGKTILRIQNTLSGEIYTELLGTYIEQLSASTNTQDLLAADMFSNFGDFKFILYIDEESGEIVKYEMDLGSIYSSIFSGMTASNEMPQEQLDALKNIKAKMIMDVMNINEAESFEIPQEALDALEMPVVTE